MNQRVHSSASVQEKHNSHFLPAIKHGQSFDLGLDFCGFRFFGAEENKLKGDAWLMMLALRQSKSNVVALEISLLRGLAEISALLPLGSDIRC